MLRASYHRAAKTVKKTPGKSLCRQEFAPRWTFSCAWLRLQRARSAL